MDIHPVQMCQSIIFVELFFEVFSIFWVEFHLEIPMGLSW